MSLKVTPVDWNSVQDKAQNKVDRKNPVHARQTLSIIKYHQVSSSIINLLILNSKGVEGGEGGGQQPSCQGAVWQRGNQVR